MAARINDNILNDSQEAQRQYQRALAIDPAHGGAKEGSDLIARELEKQGNQKSSTTHGG